MPSSKEAMKVLSLGAGVQSSTLLLMACKGLIEKPEVAIFADTGWERKETYRHLKWLRQEAHLGGIPVLVVQRGHIRDDMLNASELHSKFYHMPLFMVRDNKLFMGKRQCTANYKLRPVYAKCRELLGVTMKAKLPSDALELWIGISLDEASRMIDSKNKWVNNRFPLVELMMTRNDCIKWLYDNFNGLNIPKSSCIGCPYHDKQCWQEVYSDKEEWEDAIMVDNFIRYGHPRYQQFLHRSGKPLEEIDLRTPEDKGQLPFDFYKQERIKLFATTSPLWVMKQRVI